MKIDKTISCESEIITKLKVIAKTEGYGLDELIQRVLHSVAHGSVVARTDGRVEIPKKSYSIKLYLI